jgi:hypothetical protein
MKMYVYNIRREFEMEIEQRYMMSYFHRKGIKLPEIVSELASVYREEASTENKVKCELHEVKLRRSDCRD